MIVIRPVLEKVKIARDHIAGIAAQWPVNLYAVRLVASELVTHAIRCAETEEIRADAYTAEDGSENMYVIEVWDADAKAPGIDLCPVCLAPPDERGPWKLTDHADRWGVHHDDDDGGKVVYAAWIRPCPPSPHR
ncbi:ATP-binding protein [Spirillospora sp. CA-108201]